MSLSTLGRQLAAINNAATGGGGRDVGATLPTSKRHEDAIGRGQLHSVQVGHRISQHSTNKSDRYKPSIIYMDARKAADVPLTTVRENCIASLRHLEGTVDSEFGLFVSALCKAGKGNTSSTNVGGNTDTSAGERGLLTQAQNEKLDQKIEDLMSRLALHMNSDESSSSSSTTHPDGNVHNNGGTAGATLLSSCLHVIEFLLRRYDLHLRPRTASAALLALLPYHEEPFYLRLLQLIDLASLPEWAFLRPYAVPGARLGRSILAQQASKDTAFVRSIAQLSQRNAILLVKLELRRMQQKQQQQQHHPHDSKTAMAMGGGLSLPSSYRHQQNQKQQQQSLSFTAAVLVEAMTLQTRRMGGMDEKTCQALLPFVVSACRNKPLKGAVGVTGGMVMNEVWQNWGHIMASTMVEATVCLASEPRTLMVTSILQGISPFQPMYNNHKYSSTTTPMDDATRDGGVFWNGLVVALTILAQEPPPSSTSTSGDDNNLDCRLPLLGSTMTGGYFSSTPVRKYCGYVMDKEILSALIKLEGAAAGTNDNRNGNKQQSHNNSNTSQRLLSPSFGYLYSTEGITDFQHWVASILVVGWKRLVITYSYMKKRNDERNKNIRRSKHIFQLIQSLVDEPTLHTLWKEGNCEWVESYTAFILVESPCLGHDYEENEIIDKVVFDKDDVDDNNDKTASKTLSPYRILEAYTKSVLKSLRSRDKAAYERGLTSALIQYKKKDQRMWLAKWLGLATIPSGAQEDAIGMDVDENPVSESLSVSLPPRVALEHAEYEIRLRAIPTLIQEAKDDDDVDRMDVDRVNDGGETILQALLRRFLDDDNDQVALLAAKGLVDLMSSLRSIKLNVNELAEGALHAIASWATRPGVEGDMQSGLLSHAFHLASQAVASLRGKSDSEGTQLVSLMEALGAFMCDTDQRVSDEAAKALAQVMKTKISEKSAKVGKQAKLLLVSDETILKKYRRDLNTDDTSELIFRRRFFGVLVDAFVASLSSDNGGKKFPHVMSEAIDYIIWAVGVFQDGLTEKEVEAIASCLQLTVEFVASKPERVPSVFRDLASFNGKIFSLAVAPFMQMVCEKVKDKTGAKVAPMAIVMEILISCSASLQVKNLVSFASDIAVRDTNGNFYAVAPAITLASRPDKEIRALAIEFLALLQDNVQAGERESVFHLCQYFKTSNSTLLGGPSILSRCLSSILSSSEEGNSIKKNLMEAAICSSVTCGTFESIAPEFPRRRWLQAGEVSGGYTTALTVLEAAESAGESNFPLSQRWALAGKSLLATLLSHDCSTSENMPESYKKLVFAIMRMLKGAKMVDSSILGGSSANTIITTGPQSRGGRARSYSFGRNEGISYLNPYPKDMLDAIVSVLKSTEATSSHKMFLGSLFEIVLSSESWKREVFAVMDGSSRRKIASAVLLKAVESTMENADLIFLSLPLDASDVAAELLSIHGKSDMELSMLTYISDFVSGNAARLVGNSSIDALFASIFKQVSSLSDETAGNESIEYARQALLVSLLDLAKSLTSKEAEKLKSNRKFESWMAVLVDILGKKDNTKTTNTLSSQNKKTIFTIMVALCEQFPKAVAPKIISMIKVSMSNLTSPGESNTLTECLKLALPVYFDNVKVASLSVPGLFLCFLQGAGSYDRNLRSRLYEAFVDALGTIDTDKETSNSPVGAFLAAMLAFESNLAIESNVLKPRMAELLEMVSHIWSAIPGTSHIEALWTILSVAKDLLYDIIDEKSIPTRNFFFSASDLSLILTNSFNLTSKGAGEKNGRRKTTSVSSGEKIRKEICTLLMVVACDVVATPESRRIICHSEGTRQTQILRLWQDLLLLQSSCQNYLSGSPPPDTATFVERIGEVTGQALDAIKDSLPSHMFLAFVSNLIKEGETEELRARAVQLIADRSASIQPVGLEVALFVDMIPALFALVEKDSSSGTRTDADKVLDQSVFAAIDSIGRNVLSSNDVDKGLPQLEVFSEVVSKATNCIERENCPTTAVSPFVGANAASRQLVSSASICASTAIRVCGLRALPTLPGLMKSLLSFLSDATTFLSEIQHGDSAHLVASSQAKLMQLAILRAFGSIIENLAKFLQPYVGNMLCELSRIRGSLDGGSDTQSLSVRAEVDRVENLVTRSIPSRQLMPAAAKAIKTVSESKSLLYFIPLITNSVKHSTSSELSGQTKIVQKIATFIFEHSAKSVVQSELINSSNELLLSLVLKLSELQLRQLYSKMREWCVENDSSELESASRQLAFWRLSSSLSEQLRSIFLPCLAMAFPDAVKGLDMAVINLCEKHSLKRAGGKKKQKLAGDESFEIDPTSVKTLQALLGCLNHSLRADARNGGAWTRDTESQRFEKLLTPLGNLLQCHLATSSGGISYENLVEGDGLQTGSVVQCIVSLATAAGDEQLWKPLNHAVLQACSNEDRPEVRKAGVSCLLSLIHSIGEEYMVLIPECLPILSELLEDSDEDIAGLAQECISQSEELLGESLQDSLR